MYFKSSQMMSYCLGIPLAMQAIAGGAPYDIIIAGGAPFDITISLSIFATLLVLLSRSERPCGKEKE